MRLLLTRPAKDAARTREKLESLGHQVIVSPVIEIVGTDAVWPKGVVDGVLATSAQAFGVPWQGPMPETRRVLPLFVVGTRTAEMARVHGFLGAAHVAKNAASLAIAMGKLTGPSKRIVYLAGRERKPDIETALDVIGQPLEVVEVYEARALKTPSLDAIKALRLDAVDAVLHFSRRSAALFTSAVTGAGLDIGRPAHFCLSEDVAAPLRKAKYSAIYIAEKPSEVDLLALVGEV